MYPSKGIYRGIGAAVVSCCYKIVGLKLCVYCGLTWYKKLKIVLKKGTPSYSYLPQ
jgi:hypothetical protein